MVTQNLPAALVQCRYIDKPRRLWIDAIRIDQSNITEEEPRPGLARPGLGGWLACHVKRRHYRLGPEGWQNYDLLDTSILDSAHLVLLAVLLEHAWFTGYYGSSKTKRW
jgi:hypothetical protein